MLKYILCCSLLIGQVFAAERAPIHSNGKDGGAEATVVMSGIPDLDIMFGGEFSVFNWVKEIDEEAGFDLAEMEPFYKSLDEIGENADFNSVGADSIQSPTRPVSPVAQPQVESPVNFGSADPSADCSQTDPSVNYIPTGPIVEQSLEISPDDSDEFDPEASQRPVISQVKGGSFLSEEDDIILQFARNNGGSLRTQDLKKCSVEIFNRLGWSRTTRQIRTRFYCYLSSELCEFTKEDDELILKLVDEIGGRWSLISSKFPNHSISQLRSRYATHLKKLAQTQMEFE